MKIAQQISSAFAQSHIIVFVRTHTTYTTYTPYAVRHATLMRFFNKVEIGMKVLFDVKWAGRVVLAERVEDNTLESVHMAPADSNMVSATKSHFTLNL